MNYSRKLMIPIMLFLLIGSLVSAQDERERGFVPQWKVGDYWHLEATYKDLKTPGEPWLPPIMWVFKVRAIKQIHRQDAYVVHVYPRNRDLKVQAVLFLSVRDLRPLRVIDIFPTPTGVKSQERPVDPFHPEPLLSVDSLVPYDLPVFPLIQRSVQGADSLDAYRAPPARNFEKITAVGGLKFKSSVGQVDKAPEKQYADAFSSYRQTGEMFQIELFDSTKGDTTIQIWQENSPWALSGVSRGRKVRLMPTAAPQPQSQAPGGEQQ